MCWALATPKFYLCVYDYICGMEWGTGVGWGGDWKEVHMEAGRSLYPLKLRSLTQPRVH